MNKSKSYTKCFIIKQYKKIQKSKTFNIVLLRVHEIVIKRYHKHILNYENGLKRPLVVDEVGDDGLEVN